ncbi:ABC transporter permease subunit [Sinorhizobium meliloti]|nr:ABC transporter permease subunit [Sinorhizobium meliloti]MDW9713545.1 ABC transporter permease subunit [Sinorhizobium meliloti]MDW9750626.1 ABC transporter permease subunit [Sinorhizobium meliloti]MDX0252298.1 ABC transporter permease subunit [Sinorhizobium meliloti]MDX0359612.1 ABC transporter permease subunit [Sinorhizobium meliloti]
MMKAIRQNRVVSRTILYILLVIVLLFMTFPIYYMAITSLKTEFEALRMPPTLWPQNLTVESYPYVIQAWGYWRTLLNTVIVAGTAALAATVLGGISAYGFSRMEFAGKAILYGLLVATIAIPGMVTVGPIFLAYKDLRLLDTHVGLILVFAAEFVPFAFLTLFSYFKAIPKELDEAAAMDGSSLLDTMFRIIFPIALPGFAVTFLLLFIAGWNDFLLAFTLTITPDTRLLTVRLFEVPVREGVNRTPYDLIAAGGVLILLPLVPIVLRVQRQLVEGILAGAVKE